MKPDKIPDIIYDDIKSLKRKRYGCVNNPCWYSMSTILGFDDVENKHTLHCWKDCIKKFCDSLREHGKNIVYF